MTSAIVYVLLLCSITSCKLDNKPFQPNILTDNVEISITLTSEKEEEEFDIDLHLKKYDQLKSRIVKHKSIIKSDPEISHEKKIELAQDYISTMLIDSIFPYWIDTKWDFNGHTDEPRVGEVACGYFVSTTIRHMDVKINRYKVAQKASADIIKELCVSASIKRFNSMEKLESHLKTIEDAELLIIGLDYHVGFIFKKDGEAFLAHSNYENLKGVEIVPVENCFALESSNNYVIGNFSSNAGLTENWLKGI